MTWVYFSLLAALIWAIANTIDKFVLDKWLKNPLVPLPILGVISLATAGLVFAIHGLNPLSAAHILLALLSGVFYTLMIVFYFKAVAVEEISRISPLFGLTPIFILILAFLFLGEHFTLARYLGIILTVFGGILISLKDIKNFKLAKSFWLILLASLFVSFNHVITKYLLQFADYWTIFTYVRIGTFLCCLPFVFLLFSEMKTIAKKGGAKPFLILSFSNLLDLLGVLFITIATTTGFITLVNTLSSTQSLFVFLITLGLGVFFPHILKEEVNRSTVILKLVAIICIIIGTRLVL